MLRALRVCTSTALPGSEGPRRTLRPSCPVTQRGVVGAGFTPNHFARRGQPNRPGTDSRHGGRPPHTLPLVHDELFRRPLLFPRRLTDVNGPTIARDDHLVPAGPVARPVIHWLVASGENAQTTASLQSVLNETNLWREKSKAEATHSERASAQAPRLRSEARGRTLARKPRNSSRLSCVRGIPLVSSRLQQERSCWSFGRLPKAQRSFEQVLGGPPSPLLTRGPRASDDAV